MCSNTNDSIQNANSPAREKIIRGASEIFAQHGCKKITMDHIATKLHVSKRTIYELFETKDDLLLACLEWRHCQAKDNIRNSIQQGMEPMFVVMQVIHDITRFYMVHSKMIDDIRNFYPKVMDVMRCHHPADDLLQTQLEKAQSKGVIRPEVDAATAAEALVFISKLGDAKASVTPMENPLVLVNDMLYTYMRGLLTVESLADYNRHEAELKQLLRHEEN